METVVPTYAALPEGWCPAGPQDMLNMIAKISTAVDSRGRKVKLEWGVISPDFCETTWAEFLIEVAKIVHGYIEDTDEDVAVDISTLNLTCWIT